jgi:hypothetical protein
MNMRKSAGLILVFIFFAACMIVTMPASASTDEAENTWVSKAPIHVARTYLGAAVVGGKIYAIGGYNGSGDLGTNEEYDPVTDTWVFKASMPVPSSGFATAVYEGKIYCIGGEMNQVYDPASDSWENKTAMPTSRTYMRANVVGGKIYLIGGTVPDNKSIPGFRNLSANEVYDPATDTWTTKTPIPNATTISASVTVGNKIYVIGREAVSSFDNLNQIYDPQTDRWTLGSTPPRGELDTAGATTGVYAPERIYFCYGTRFYDPIKDSVGDFADIPTGRFDMAVAVLNDKLYTIGGFTVTWEMMSPSDTTVTYKDAVEEYTPYGYGTVPPVVHLVSLENNKTHVGAEVDLNFTVNKPVAWIGYSLDGQDNVTITGNTTVTGLASGVHNVTVYAKDQFENMGNSETVFFSVTEPFPTVPVAAGVTVAVAVSLGLLIYFKKRKHATTI